MKGLYQDKVVSLITASLEHVWEVAVHTATEVILLDPESIEVSFSEDWSPFAQVNVTVAIPDASTLDKIDPRINQRLVIKAGYRYPDAVLDLQPLATVLLRDRRVDRPSDTMTLTAYSDEIRLQEYRKLWAGAGAQPPATGINEITNYFVNFAGGPDKSPIVSEFPAGFGAVNLTDMEMSPGDSFWNGLADAANRTGAYIFCDETRKWRVKYPAQQGSPVHALSVGEAGTVITSSSNLSRNIWANSALIEYQFKINNVDTTVYGRATVASGPFAPQATGYVTYYETRNIRVNQTQANNAATSVLKNLVTRGRELTLTAHSAYWLRPGDTVTVQLLTGVTELHIVKSVSFNAASGTMTLATRQPTNVSILTGE